METEQIYDLLDAAAKKYPIKALAPEIDKAESTLRNELTRQEGYKLGLSTMILIMQKTGDLTALDAVETMFNRAAFPIPTANSLTPTPLMMKISKLSKEFSECVGELAKSLEDDGKVTGKELDRCIKENKDLIKACLELELYLNHQKECESG